MLLFTAFVAVAAGVVFGIVPALQSSRSDVQSTLREEGHTATGSFSRLRWQRVLVGVEVALALVLLVGGGLLINSFARLQAVDPGFETENMLTMRLTLARERYRQEEVRRGVRASFPTPTSPLSAPATSALWDPADARPRLR